MLVGTFHWHIAKKQNPLWREGRLTYFADDSSRSDDDGPVGGPEDQLEKQEVPTDKTLEAEVNVSSLMEQYRGKLDRVGALVAKATVDTPLVLKTALDILEVQQHQRQLQNPELAELLPKARAYLRDKEEGTYNGPPKHELIDAITAQLNQPQLSLVITQAFDTRAQLYDEKFTTLNGTSPKEVARIASEFKLSETDDNKLILAKLSNGEIDTLIQRLGITVPESFQCGADEKDNVDTQRTKSKLWASLQKAIPGLTNAFGGTKAPRSVKETLIHKKIQAALKLAVMEQTDFATESTVSDLEEVKRKLAKGAVHARRHLERTLRLEASTLNDRWRAFRKQLSHAAGGGTTEQIAAYLGSSPLATEQKFYDIEAVLQYATRTAEQSDELQKVDNINLPGISQENFTASAKTALEKMNALSWLMTTDFEQQKKKFIPENISDENDAKSWASTRADKLEKLVNMDPDELEEIVALVYKENPDPEDADEMMISLEENAASAMRVREGKETPKDLDHLHEDLPERKRKWYDMLLLAMSSAAFRRSIQKNRELIEADSTENTDVARNAAASALRKVGEKIFTAGPGTALRHPALRHELCQGVYVQESLTKLYKRVENDVAHAKVMFDAKGNPLPKGTQILRESRNAIAKLEATVEELDRLMATDEDGRVITLDQIEAYEQKAGTRKSVGCYHRGDGNIYINEQALQDASAREKIDLETLRKQTIHHERGHAIYDILTTRVGALPMLMIALDLEMSQPLPGDPHKRTLEDLVWKRSEDWGIELLRKRYFDQELENVQSQGLGRSLEMDTTIAKRRSNDRLREHLMDEMANKYASWKHQGKTDDGFSEADTQIFRILDKDPRELERIKMDKSVIADLKRPGDQTDDGPVQSFRDDRTQDDAMGDEAFGRMATGETGGKAPDTATEGALLSDRIINAQNDLLVLKEFIKNHQDVDGVKEFEAWVMEWETAFNDRVRKPFYAINNPSRPSDIQFTSEMDTIDQHFLGPAKKQKDDVTKAEMEASGSQKKGGLMQTLRSIEMASINDVIGVFSSMGEDLQRMWKRRGERVQSVMGKNLTDWIPDNNIWGAKYAGQLKHEFERRSNASEQEEVKQWKDAYENLDSYSLTEQLEVSRNKDEVRAIIELLTERGRLDWNNVKFWKTLKELSGLPIPIGACEGDSRVRDQWLQRMATAIWDNDKDKYFDWRQANDSGVESGKKKFTQVADQLSNMSKGLAGALQQQLKMWVGAKKSGSSIPEEVNPHLYEEILHYAMRNGKMSMEEKMYYLVQGIAHGLITVDRLQALNGEHGGILNSFPVIDYFMFRHNTLPELKALGKRIDEGNFKPGAQTTIWLHLEVLRDEYAQMRISKATSGTRAETLDHEDIPTVMAYADFRTVERLLEVISGGREKMSPEAVKNAYTGFGTKFKVLSQLAELNMLNGTDIEELAKGVAAYIHYDNAITRNGKFKETYTKMSWREFRTTSPSSNGLSVDDFRKANSTFVKELINTVGDQIDWERVKVKKEHILRDVNDTAQHANDTEREHIQAGMEVFSTEIERVIKQNPHAVLEILKKNRNLLLEEGEATKDRAESKQYINAAVLRTYMKNRSQHSELATAA